MTIRQPKLVDPRGNFIRSRSMAAVVGGQIGSKPSRGYLIGGGTPLYDSGKSRYTDSSNAVGTDYAKDSRQLITTTAWRNLVSAARFLFANVPIVRGALLEQCNYSFPLEPQYTGKDKAWGKMAEEWLWQWYSINNVKGPAYSSWHVSRLRCLGYKIDGDIGTLLTKSADGYPMIQLIPAHRIGSRWSDGLVTDGPYAGLLCVNGCVMNDTGRVVGYRVLGLTADDDQWVSAHDLFLTFRPDFSDQVRGISHLCASIASFADIKRLREYEMRAQQIASSIGLIEKNESGAVDEAAWAVTRPSDFSSSESTASGLITESHEAGTIRYFKSGSGAGLESLRSDRPSSDASVFEDKIVSGALYGIEWDPNFALAIREPGGAWARTVLQKIRRSIKNNHWLEAQAKRREDGYAISVAIKSGLIPAPADGDWYSWEYAATQPQLTADSGNEENAKREAYKLGTMTLRDLTGERGKWWEEERDQRDLEVRDLLTRAGALATDFGISVQDALTLLEQRTPNAAPSSGAANQQSQPQE